MGGFNNKVNDNRIVYIDPNNVHGDINGTTATPEYTDFCLWCNLVVERSSRIKNQIGGTNDDGTVAMQYDLMKAANGTEYVSFMRGNDINNYNYLTTDYTDIDFNSIKKRNIVEGLQIEDVSISMTNYTCPKVTIKFIDIRGGGFFGREEATHNEYGKLKDLEIDSDGQLIDNIFGGFVSFPYPRFKLQVKGFYGRDVTYQLTCSGFSGNFNSSNGNFEITAQFIGYEYGVLADIPFDYIVAAPLTERGGAYWDEQVRIAQANNQNGWMLSNINGSELEPPFKLYDFYDRVKAAIEELGDGDDGMSLLVDDSLVTAVSDYDDIITSIKQIKSYVTNFKRALTDCYGVDYITSVLSGDKEMLMIHSKTPSMVLTSNIADAYNILAATVTQFSNERPGIGITTHLIPNCPFDGYWDEWRSGMVTAKKFCEYRSGSSGSRSNIISASNVDGGINGSVIADKNSCNGVNVCCYNNSDTEITIPPVLSEQIYNNFNIWDWCSTGNGYAKYATIIDFNSITNKLNEILTDIEIKQRNYNDEILNNGHKTIREIVGFTPYVGNYFKVVMCHLETFVELFKETADAIYSDMNNGRRKPSKLGIHNLDVETDVPSASTTDVPPFPAVYRRYTTVADSIEQHRKSDTMDVKFDSWVGNFKGSVEWHEKVLVDELYLALQKVQLARVNDEYATASTHTETEMATFSLIPNDIRSRIPIYAYSSRETLALYTALRAEVIFSQLNRGNKVDDEHAKMFGVLDAYNYILQTPSINKLMNITSVSGDGITLADELSAISKAENNGRSDTYEFEVAKVENGRQPVYEEENGGKLAYVYMRNKEKGVVIPMNSYNNFNSGTLNSDYTWKDGMFKVRNVHDSSYMFSQNANDFLASNEGQGSMDDEYVNTQMFDVDGGYDNKLLNGKLLCCYDKITNGDTKIANLDKDKLKNFVNKYWLTDNHCLSFYGKSEKESYKTYKDVFSDNADNRVCDGLTIPKAMHGITTKEATEKFIKDFKSKIKK